MQKRLFALMFALFINAAIYTSPLHAQESQTVGVNIPFAFSAQGKTLPAGYYRIEPVGSNRDIWGIRGVGAGTPSNSFVLAMTRKGSSDGKLAVTFHRYGEFNFLAGFKTSSYEIELPATKQEKALRVSNRPLSQMEVVQVESANAASATDKR